ncbi:MAG TPA: PHP domain-containing protein [Actinomycetota bacterium]|nr:PHP domain-containing protein [Actinomycetota bacterium]
MDTLSNGALAELLARAAEDEEGHRARALRRAARAALQWPEETATLVGRGASLLDLRGVGPWVAARIRSWLESPPEVPEPPALRSGFMTMAEARAVLAEHPGWRSDIRADLQMHTTWSDGSAPLEEMAERAAARGYAHVAVTDHSKGLPIARGMDEATLVAQGREIDALNRRMEASGGGFRVLRSLEMNLSPAGEGDMDLEVLAGLDLVLGAFHSRLRVTDDQTERYLAALANRSVHVLAHPRGRRWGARAGLRAEWDVVFRAAAAAGVALEIDAFPDRQDLDVALAGEAARAGAWISIGTDAHHPGELAFMELGLAIAIRGGVPKERILNFLPRGELLKWAERRG